ncbi:MAG: TIGR03936 family radical SAM-associated protein [Planctomycetota bacterium]
MRIWFGKQGDLRWIGHRDLMRCMERLFRRADLPLALSEGFHPKPRMTFPSALAVGIEAGGEVMELEINRPMTADDIHHRLKRHAVPGLEIRSVDVLPPQSPRVRVVGGVYETVVPAEARPQLAERIDAIKAGQGSLVQRNPERPPVDLRLQLTELSLLGGVLRFGLRAGEQGSAGPRDVLAALGLVDFERQGGLLRRVAVQTG